LKKYANAVYYEDEMLNGNRVLYDRKIFFDMGAFSGSAGGDLAGAVGFFL
jgi:hypothetical protein